MAPAPFLALRVLKQLVLDDGEKYPFACSVLHDNIYVDDILFGADDGVTIKTKREQLCSLLAGGGFELRKWASNWSELLSDIEIKSHGEERSKLFQNDDRIKILGLMWDCSEDSFKFPVTIDGSAPLTKRTILSTIAKLFDPLGLVTPVTVNAKIIMQQLWQKKIDWDEDIPRDISTRWQNIYSQLPSLSRLTIPRWTHQHAQVMRSEIHGFADASSSAYAAAVYLRVLTQSGDVKITLLAGKSKVAPVTPLSIPRLELAAAVLLSRLVKFVQESCSYDSCYYWTDSMVVLAWLSKHPSNWKAFVANRVAEVQSRLPEGVWRHVSTHENPADCASRGLLAEELIAHKLWWHGPSWLSMPDSHWPPPKSIAQNLNVDSERRHVVANLASIPQVWDLSTRYSSWNKLIRVTGYVLRFVKNCRASPIKTSNNNITSIALSAEEQHDAKRVWLKQMQATAFSDEIKALRSKRAISKKSALLPLNPFLDGDGLLRVGGRLRNSDLSFTQRHPVILASNTVVALLISNIHLRMLHAGLQLTLSTLRQEFWLLRARSVVKAVLHRCVRCAREKATIPSQLMGNLPTPRISTPSRSFAHSGVDYAGPIQIRPSARRGLRADKAYIALFICLATKAVHLELVSSYSAQSFLDAFSRFCARRGLPQSMYSDNGTTFVGADRELTKAYRHAIRDPTFQNKVASDDVTWRFIPPSAPHFGGLWEAGVRSLKYHLRRVVGNHTLTYEELTTVLCRIEACLNSRPLAPLTDAPDDCEYLTPGHFLVGSNLTIPPEPSVYTVNENRLSRWQLIRHITEQLWRLWRTDYLHSLQQRVKWRESKPPVKKGQLVLLRNNTLPPCKWELGRVVDCHPGSDGHIRVVTIRTATSEYTRPIVKLCLLPVDIENHESLTTADD